MSYVLPKPPVAIPLPFLIVCEGYGDAIFLDSLLASNAIATCNVACPNKDTCQGRAGGTELQRYLGAIKFIHRKQNPPTLKGLLVIVDADTDPAVQFRQAKEALEFAEF